MPSSRQLAAAIPDLALGLAFLLVWLAPFPLAPTAVAFFTTLVVLEFLIIQASTFAAATLEKEGSKNARIAKLFAIGVISSMFVGVLAVLNQSPWPLVSFWSLMLNRMSGMLLGRSPRGEGSFARRSWSAAMALYLGCAVVAAIRPWPRFGLTDEVLAAQVRLGHGPKPGAAHQFIVLGFLYFTLIGLSELRSHSWVGRAGIKNRGGRQRAERLAKQRDAA